jgi:hypothetical protein
MNIIINQYDILRDPVRIRAVANGIWNLKAARKLKELLTSLDPRNTIINIHTCSKALSASIIKTALKYKFKTIYHLHDYGIACPNLGFYNYQTQQICKLKPLSMNCFLCNCDSRRFSHKIWRFLRQITLIHFGKIRRIKDFIAVSNSDTCAAQQFIIDQQTGLRFSTGDEADLMSKIQNLNDIHLTRKMGLTAYQKFWSDPPTVDKYINELEKIFEEIL